MDPNSRRWLNRLTHSGVANSTTRNDRYTARRHRRSSPCVCRGLPPHGKRWWGRLYGKGSKRHEVPAHHNLDAYLDSDIKAVGVRDAGQTWPSTAPISYSGVPALASADARLLRRSWMRRSAGRATAFFGPRSDPPQPLQRPLPSLYRWGTRTGCPVLAAWPATAVPARSPRTAGRAVASRYSTAARSARRGRGRPGPTWPARPAPSSPRSGSAALAPTPSPPLGRLSFQLSMLNSICLFRKFKAV
jgi:hypothetical protein